MVLNEDLDVSLEVRVGGNPSWPDGFGRWPLREGRNSGNNWHVVTHPSFTRSGYAKDLRLDAELLMGRSGYVSVDAVDAEEVGNAVSRGP